MDMERRPHLRVALTPYCDFDCGYCRPGGEGYFRDLHRTLNDDELVEVVSLCAEAGFRHLKFTGGEPLLRKDVEGIVARVSALRVYESIDLVTNGAHLREHASRLKDAGLDAVTVSLDAAERQCFLRMTRRDRFAQVIDGIRAAVQVGLPTRINTVYVRSNEDQLEGLIRVADETGAELKLIDAMNVSPDDPNAEEDWRKGYVALTTVVERLRDRTSASSVSRPPGGLGTPMTVLTLDSGTRVLLRDASVGTNYDPATCHTCRFYPCQDALISLRVTHDGHLKRCLIRNDNLVDVITPLRQGGRDEALQRVRSCHDILCRAGYEPNAWRFPHGAA